MENEELNQTLASLWDSLTDEQKERAQACASVDELFAFASEEKIELPADLLDEVAGGYVFENFQEKSFEVIRDSDGEVLERGFETSHEAEKRARQLGQSDKRINWDALEYLRIKC